jgi:hypothetical protein
MASSWLSPSFMRTNIKEAFTKFPYCIATYVGLGGFIVLIAKGILYHLSR